MAGKTDADVKTCFVIMPISDVDGYPVGHFGEVYKQLIEPAVVAAGYVCSLATSTNAAHMIQLDVVTKVATADLCICDLSNNNPNVLFEYGIRQAFDKPTVLIKDDKTRRIFDLSGFRDIEYDHTLRIANTLGSREEITIAIRDTVDGSNDSDQVFSLVKLMKLTKAALPTGEVSKDDARFALLEKKIDSIVSILNPRHSRPTGFFAQLLGDKDTAVGLNFGMNNRWTVTFADDRVYVSDAKKNNKTEYFDQPSLEKSEFFRTLLPPEKIDFTTALHNFSPGIIPF